jgi:hypothetical protein
MKVKLRWRVVLVLVYVILSVIYTTVDLIANLIY